MTDIVVDGVVYHVHAYIFGAFWTGYIVFDNEYLCALPSSTAHHILILRARERLNEIHDGREKK